MRQRPIHVVVDTGSSVAVYVQIMEQIRQRVREGRLPPGTPLPSVRQLASQLDLNPNTVAKAYAFLEREGTLKTVPRRGCFVGDGADGERQPDRRAEEAANRVLDDARARGIEPGQVLEALRRRLEGEGSPLRRRRR